MKNILLLCFIALTLSHSLTAQNNDAQLKLGYNLFALSPNVTVPASTSLSTIGGTTSTNRAFTFEAWIKVATDGPIVPQVFSKRTTVNNGFLWGISTGGKLYLRMNNVDVIDNINTSYPATAAYPTTTLKDGKYHHVAVSRSNSGTVKYYIDGILVGTFTNTATVALNCNLVIGRDPLVNLFTNFKGLIDDVRIWSVERTQTQIAANRCNLATPYLSSLKSYWKCNEGTGTTLIDATTNANTGNFGGSGGNNPDWAVRNVLVLNNLTNIFEDNQILTENVVFESFPDSALWHDGTQDSIQHCYNPDWYSQLNASTNMHDMSFKLYRPNPAFDKSCTTTYPCIIYVHGGGYANKVNANALHGDDICRDLAKCGYIVIGINYRKGLDIAGVTNLPSGGIIEGYSDCSSEPNNTFSFIEATYRMVQDVKAAHARVLAGAIAWKINANQVFYMGVSTGGCAVLNAAYGADDMPNYREEPNSTTNLTTLASKNGSILQYATHTAPSGTSVDNVAGVISVAGAIHNLNWIGNRADGKDKIPAYLSHGTADSAVPFCSGNLLNINFYNGIGNSTHLDLYGSGPVYDKIRTFTTPSSFKSYLVSYTNAEHDMQVVGNTCNDLERLARVWYTYFTMTVFSASKINNATFTNTVISVAPSCNLVTQESPNVASCCSSANCGYGGYTNKTAPESTPTYDFSATLTLSPNPAQSYTNVNYTSLIDEPATITLYDLTGRVVRQMDTEVTEGNNTYNLQLDDLTPGIYLLQLKTPTQQLSDKIQIMK